MFRVTFDEIIISVVIWLTAFLTYRSAFSKPVRKSDNYIFFFIIVCIFSTFAFITGDFAHYHELYESLYLGAPRYSLEKVYYDLLLLLPHSFYLWRLVIWGLSTLFLVLVFKRIHSPVRLSCLFFILILISGFSNLRNTLGIEIMFYALTFILIPQKNRIQSYFICFLLLWLCLYFHKSMPLYIGVAILSFKSIKGWMYKVSIIAFPFVYASFRLISSYILSLDLGGGAFEATGTNYLESENFSVTNFYGYISLIVARLPLLMLLYYVISRILKGEIINKVVIFFSQYTYWLIYLSFLFFNQPTSSFLSVRFWDASLYSMVFVFPLALYMNNEKVVRVGYRLLVFAAFYSLFYSIYRAY